MPPVIPGQNGSQPNQPDFLRWLQQVFPQLAPQQPRSLSAPDGNTGGRDLSVNLQTSAGGGPQRTPTSREEVLLAEFIDQLRSPLDFNDPMVASILRQSTSATAQEAQNRGIQGGLALSQQQQAYINAAAQLNQARQQQLGSLLNAGANRAMQREDMNYNRWLQDQAQGQDAWRTGGSILGGVGGAAAGLLIPGAQPALPALIAGGSQLGAGIGGSAYGAFNPQAQRPTYSSRTPSFF
jgi:hypothetical protein